MTRLYVEPDTNASRQATAWTTPDPAGAALMRRISTQPQALWLGTEWTPDPAATVDAAVTVARTQLRVFVCYSIPGRDGDAFSAGGSTTTAAYWAFVAGIARGLRGRKAIVVLEPDATCLVEHLDAAAMAKRLDMLSAAVDTLTAAGARVYLDAGDSDWIPAAALAPRLVGAGVKRAAGVAINVSHYESDTDSIAYAERLRAILGDVHYVVDTSRNGRAGAGACWANCPGMGLGRAPTLTTGVVGCDARLWVKRPGESDGKANGGPAAGVWWPACARGLAERAAP